MNRLRRTSQVHATWLECGSGGGNVRSVYAPEPPLLRLLRAIGGQHTQCGTEISKLAPEIEPEKEIGATEGQTPV